MQATESGSPSGAHGSLTKHTFWLMLAKTIAFVFSLALPLLVVRSLSQLEFGQYKQAFLVIATAMNVLPLGFNMTVYYYLPRERERQPQVVFHLLLIGLCAGLVATAVCLIYPQALVALFREPALATYAPWIGAIVPLWIVGGLLEVIPVANHEVRVATAFIVLTQFTRTTILFLAAFWFASVLALLVGALLQGLVQTGILLVYLHKRFPGFWRGIDRSLLKAQLRYGLPLGMAGLLYTFQTDLHNYFVSHRFGTEAFALYSIGCFQLPFIGLIGEAASAVMIARVSTLAQTGSVFEILALTARSMRKLSAVYFPAYAILMITGPEFIELLFTRRYAASWPIFAVNLTLLPASVLFTDPIIRAYPRHMPVLLRMRVLLLAFLFAGLWFGTRHYGLLGAVGVAVGLGLLERAFTTWYFVGRVLEFRRRDLRLFGDSAKVALAAAIAALATLPLHKYLAGAAPLRVLLVCGALYALVYVALLLGLRIPTPGERALVRGWIRRPRWSRGTASPLS